MKGEFDDTGIVFKSLGLPSLQMETLKGVDVSLQWYQRFIRDLSYKPLMVPSVDMVFHVTTFPFWY